MTGQNVLNCLHERIDLWDMVDTVEMYFCGNDYMFVCVCVCVCACACISINCVSCAMHMG